MNNYFKNNLKTKVFFICQSRMQLWLALNYLQISVCEQKVPNKEDYKKVIKDFKESTKDCKCRDCRYFRFISKTNKE